MIKDFDWWFPYVPGLRTRYVLAYVGVNDFTVEHSREYDEMLDPSARETHPLRTAIKERSAFYGLYETLAGRRKASGVLTLKKDVDWTTVKWTAQSLRSDHEEMMRENLAAYASRLRLLASRIRAIGAVPIFVTQRWSLYRSEGGGIVGVNETFPFANTTTINGVDWAQMMKLLNTTTVQTALEENVACIDLASELEIPTEDFVDWCHTNRAGAKKIGSFLGERITTIIQPK